MTHQSEAAADADAELPIAVPAVSVDRAEFTPDTAPMESPAETLEAENRDASAKSGTTAIATAGDNASSGETPSHSLWLTDRDQQVLVVACALLFMSFAWRMWQLSHVDHSTSAIQRDVAGTGYLIDLNVATWPELTQLEGVGPVLAQRIIADRDENGPFASIDDLERVKGIGPKTVEKNRQWLKVAGNASLIDGH